MDNEATVLRQELGRVAAGRGKRYPRELRQRVVKWASAQHRAGASWGSIKEALGQKFDTVRRWCLDGAAKPMVPVRVVAEREVRTHSVVSPSGFRVDGLSVSEAAALLRELG